MKKSLANIAEAYEILLSSQQSQLISLFEALKLGAKNNESRFVLVQISEDIENQLKTYFDASEVLMSVALYDKYLSHHDYKKDLLLKIHIFSDEIHRINYKFFEEKIVFFEAELKKHIQEMNNLLKDLIELKNRQKDGHSSEIILDIDIIDYQHEKIDHLIKIIIDKSINKASIDEVNQLTNELMHKIMQHFAFEEFFFLQYKYPETEEHKKAHQTFSSNIIVNFNKLKLQANQSSYVDYFKNLREELFHHIETEDAKYTKYIKEVREKV